MQKYQNLTVHAFSNLLSGTVYSFGIVPVINSQFTRLPEELISFSPSRKVFPRGFLWDDGFHLEVVCGARLNRKTDELCARVVDSWLRNMDIFGYISREQARGVEVTEMIPERFQ